MSSSVSKANRWMSKMLAVEEPGKTILDKNADPVKKDRGKGSWKTDKVFNKALRHLTVLHDRVKNNPTKAAKLHKDMLVVVGKMQDMAEGVPPGRLRKLFKVIGETWKASRGPSNSRAPSSTKGVTDPSLASVDATTRAAVQKQFDLFTLKGKEVKLSGKEANAAGSDWESYQSSNPVVGSDLNDRQISIKEFLDSPLGELKSAKGDVDKFVKDQYDDLEACCEGFSTFAKKKFDKQHAKNRYRNVTCPDHTRVSTNESGGYINANHVWTDGGVHCIVAQGPVATTYKDHFNMIVHNKVHTQVRLTRAVEGRREKCYPYWAMPEEGAESYFYETDDYEVEVTVMKPLDERKENKHLYQSQLIFRKGGEHVHTCTMLHFETWPDHGVPKRGTGFDRFMDLLKRTDRMMGDNPDVPICVHCSAGIGRSGAFVAALSQIRKIRMERKEKKQNRDIHLNIMKVVAQLRYHRPNMIQSPEQLQLIYQAIKDYVNNPSERV